jgi:ADP-ribose pyrophosphatase YjhB (NUDIX family)
MAAPPQPLTPDTARFCPLCGGALERRPQPPTDRLEPVCGRCRFVFYLDRKVVAGAIVWEAGRLLLTRRAIHPAYGRWTFPGGYVDWGEPVEAGAVRETREETGLEVDLRGLVGVYSYPDSPAVIVVYRARIIGGTLRLCHENDRVEWVAPAAIPWNELAFPSTTAALRDFLAARCAPADGDRSPDRGDVVRPLHPA